MPKRDPIPAHILLDHSPSAFSLHFVQDFVRNFRALSHVDRTLEHGFGRSRLESGMRNSFDLKQTARELDVSVFGRKNCEMFGGGRRGWRLASRPWIFVKFRKRAFLAPTVGQ